MGRQPKKRVRVKMSDPVTCTKCNVTKTGMDFAKSKRTSNGLQKMCKQCHHEYNTSEERRAKNRKYQREYVAKNKEKITRYYRKYKQQNRASQEIKANSILECSTCKKSYPAAEGFYHNPSAHRGYAYKCKSCSIAYNRDAKRREKKRLYDQEYFKNITPKQRMNHKANRDRKPYYSVVEYVASDGSKGYFVTNNITQRVSNIEIQKGFQILVIHTVKTFKDKKEAFKYKSFLKKGLHKS